MVGGIGTRKQLDFFSIISRAMRFTEYPDLLIQLEVYLFLTQDNVVSRSSCHPNFFLITVLVTSDFLIRDLNLHMDFCKAVLCLLLKFCTDKLELN